MIVDDILFFIAYYGFLVALFFAILKFILLLWYKKGNYKFAFSNFLYLKPRLTLSTTEMSKSKWAAFRKYYYLVSWAKYLSLILWFIYFVVIMMLKSR